MRVMHCVWRMGLGGAERQLVQLCRALVRRGAEVFVVSTFAGELDPALAATGAIPERVPASHKYDLRVIPRLASVIRRLEPDVVQTWLTQMDLVGGAAARRTKTPWILSERSSAAAYPRTAVNTMRRIIGARATAIAANSRGGLEYWSRFVDTSRIRVIPNIVPQDEIDAIAAGREDDLILFAGRLSPEKNLTNLLHALAIVFRQRPARAVFCGDGPLRTMLEQTARELHIADRVTFAGSVANVWEWMKRAAVSVSVSTFEGNPNVVLESIAAGAPLVCSDIAAHREIVDESSATIVDGDRAESIADGIVNVLTDSATAASRAGTARASVAARSADAVAAQYESLYREIAGSVN